MVKSAFFVLALAGSAASASDILPASPLMGDVTRAQFMERASASPCRTKTVTACCRLPRKRPTWQSWLA